MMGKSLFSTSVGPFTFTVLFGRMQTPAIADRQPYIQRESQQQLFLTQIFFGEDSGNVSIFVASIKGTFGLMSEDRIMIWRDVMQWLE